MIEYDTKRDVYFLALLRDIKPILCYYLCLQVVSHSESRTIWFAVKSSVLSRSILHNRSMLVTGGYCVG